MHHLTTAIVLLGVSSLLVSQIPMPCTFQPVSPGEPGGYCATRTIIFHDGFPVAWYVQLGLILIGLRYRRELDNELRWDSQPETED